MVFGEPGVSGCHAQSLAAAQITAGLEFVIFPIRRTKVTIAISTNQVALRQGYVVKILAQVISISGEYSSKMTRDVILLVVRLNIMFRFYSRRCMG